jgi:hypothetical protein
MLYTYDATFEDGYRDEHLLSTDGDAESVKAHMNGECSQRFMRHDANFHGKITRIEQVAS